MAYNQVRQRKSKVKAGMIVAMIIGSRTVLQPGITCVSLIMQHLECLL